MTKPDTVLRDLRDVTTIMTKPDTALRDQHVMTTMTKPDTVLRVQHDNMMTVATKTWHLPSVCAHPPLSTYVAVAVALAHDHPWTTIFHTAL